MTVLSNVLDHKNVAIANIAWAVFHVWIAIEIEESMGFLAIVVLIELANLSAVIASSRI